MVANQKTPVSQKSKFYFAFWFEFNIVLKKDIRSSMLKMWMSFLNILIFTTVHPCQMWTDLARFLFRRLRSGEACGATGPCPVDLNSACWTCCIREEPWETDGWCSVVLQRLVRVEDWELHKIHQETGSPLGRRARPDSVYSLYAFCWIRLFHSSGWNNSIRAKALICCYELACCRGSLVATVLAANP